MNAEKLDAQDDINSRDVLWAVAATAMNWATQQWHIPVFVGQDSAGSWREVALKLFEHLEASKVSTSVIETDNEDALGRD